MKKTLVFVANFLLVLGFILLLSSCRQAQLPSYLGVTITPTIIATSPITITPTLVPSRPAPTVTVTETVIVTETITIRPTMTITATVTEIGYALSSDAMWLTYLSKNGHGLTVVNQDGTGRTLLMDPAYEDRWYYPSGFCDSSNDPSTGWDPLSRKAVFGEVVYFVNHSRFMHNLGLCPIEPFIGDISDGLLARMERVDNNNVAELTFYESPSMSVRDRIPQFKCRAEHECSYDGGWQNLLWSHSGRYLAFSASWESKSIDVYIYDRQERSVRKLTAGPDGGGRSVVSWSPNDEWIIVEDRLSHDLFTSSVSAVSLTTGEIRLLYAVDNLRYQSVLAWLSNNRFLAYGGNVHNPLERGGDLLLVDLAGYVQSLFSGEFHWVEFIKASNLVGILQSAGSTHLVSLKDFKATEFDGSYEWNDELGKFVDHWPCQETPKKIKTLDVRGKTECIDAPTPVVPVWADHTPSPDGKWQVVLQDGQIVLQYGDQTTVSFGSNGPVTQVIWCPDSTCFFFVANRSLYRASIPYLYSQTIDEELEADRITYQWMAP